MKKLTMLDELKSHIEMLEELVRCDRVELEEEKACSRSSRRMLAWYEAKIQARELEIENLEAMVSRWESKEGGA